MENSMEVPLKMKNGATIWSSNPTPGHISRKVENPNLEWYMYPGIHSIIIYSIHDMEYIMRKAGLDES